MKRTSCTLALALLFAAKREAHAQSAPPKPEVFYPLPRVHVFADLSYVRAQNAKSCPDESAFRSLVAGWMGIDSFMHNPRGAHVGRIRVGLARTPRGFTFSYSWENAEGATKTARFIDKDCSRVVDQAVMSLTNQLTIVGINLGTKLAASSPPKKKLCPPSRAPLPCPPPPTPTDSPYSVWPKEPPMPAPEEKQTLPDRWPLAVRLGLSVGPELVAKGWGSLGVSAELGMRYRFFSVGAELHGDLPIGSRSYPEVGEVHIARISGALLLCAHYSWFVGCGVIDAGRIFFPHHVAALPASVFYSAAGVRAGLEFPIVPPRLFVRTTVDLRVPIYSASYATKSGDVFETAGLGVGLGLGFVAELDP